MKKFTPKQKTTSDDTPLIKVMIDHKTLITVRSEKAVKMWQERYPNARVVV